MDLGCKVMICSNNIQALTLFFFINQYHCILICILKYYSVYASFSFFFQPIILLSISWEEMNSKMQFEEISY